MPPTNLVSLAGLIADRTALPEHEAELFVSAQLQRLQASVNPRRISTTHARKIMTAAESEHPRRTYSPTVHRTPAPVGVGDIAALVSPMFNVPPRSAEQAVYRELSALQAQRAALIPPSDLAARDVLQVLGNLLRATRTRANARQ